MVKQDKPTPSSTSRRAVIAGATGVAVVPKRSATTLPFGPNAFAHQLDDGPIVVADPDAPIEYGCRVLLVHISKNPRVSSAFDGRCETKHPAKAKSGITVMCKHMGVTPLTCCPIAGSKRIGYQYARRGGKIQLISLNRKWRPCALDKKQGDRIVGVVTEHSRRRPLSD